MEDLSLTCDGLVTDCGSRVSRVVRLGPLYRFLAGLLCPLSLGPTTCGGDGSRKVPAAEGRRAGSEGAGR